MTALAESFVFGFANSLHCAGMCGPLAACGLGARGGVAAYHGARLAAYGGAGVLVGSAGAAVGTSGWSGSSAWISFLLAGSLLLFAAGGTRYLARVPGLSAVTRRAASWSASRSALARASTLGALTPLLPCGLLYAVYGAAFVSGSGAGGGGVTLGFALGSLPVLLLAQLNMGWIRQRLGDLGRDRLQRGAMLAAAAVLLWRGWVNLENGSCCLG